MSDVVESIHRDHANLAKLLDAVERQLALFDAGESPDYDIIRGVADYCLNYPDLYHHPKEDLIFQHLRQRDPLVVQQVGNLEDEHRSLGELTRHFAAALHNVLRDAEVPREAFDKAAREFLDTYRAHMRKEEEIFLPAAERTLDEADWREIDAQIARYEDPVFGPGGEERFQDVLATTIGNRLEERRFHARKVFSRHATFATGCCRNTGATTR